MRPQRLRAARAPKSLLPVLLLALAACGPDAAEAELAVAAPHALPVADAHGGDADRDLPADPEVRDIEVRDGYEALALLMEGNERFVTNNPRHGHVSSERRHFLERSQDPFGIVLGCADSRVPPELIFDVGLGDTFVIRVAGNIVDENEAGSIEYALAHLKTPLVLVLGHERCGAITAALDVREEKEPEELEHLLADLLPGVEGIDPALAKAERIHLGVELNVMRQVNELARIAAGIEGLNPGLLIVGGVYELDSGRVRLLKGCEAGPAVVAAAH